MLIVDEYNYAAKASSLPLLKLRTGPLPSDFVKKDSFFTDLPRGFRQNSFRVIENEDDN